MPGAGESAEALKAFSAQKTEFYWVRSQRPLCCPYNRRGAG